MFEGLDALHTACGERGDHRRGWEFVRAVAAAFGRPLIKGDGVDGGRLQAAEDRIGILLPAALREAYLLFGRRRDLTAAQDRLVLPEQLRTDADGVLVFRLEAQYCAWWGVPAGLSARTTPRSW